MELWGEGVGLGLDGDDDDDGGSDDGGGGGTDMGFYWCNMHWGPLL